MANHSSATAHPHVTRTTRTNTIMNVLKQRAEAVLNDNTIDPQSRAIIRCAMETNDPWLARLVRSADAVESQEAGNGGDDGHRDKVEALAEIICGSGEGPAAALLVLMGTMQNSAEPGVIANTVKHFALTRCGEMNAFGMVEAQIAVVEGELLG